MMGLSHFKHTNVNLTNKCRSQWLIFGLLIFCAMAIIHQCIDEDHYSEDLKNEIKGRNLQDESGDYEIQWSLSLKGEEYLLDSPFLKAGLELAIKNYINLELKCTAAEENDDEGSSFYGVEIIEDPGKNLKQLSGNGKCKGKKKRCKRNVKESVLDYLPPPDNNTNIENSTNMKQPYQTKNNICDLLDSNETSIFDSFQYILMTASSFNYHVELQVFEENRFGNIDFNVDFLPESSLGLDQIDEIDLEALEPVATTTQCNEQCVSQEAIMIDIFNHFDIPIDVSKHECWYEGINCNTDGFVTHIWFVNRGLENYTIPNLFHQLPSLKGLFLGENNLVGTIPSTLGTRRQPLELLWLQDNLLTGTIPSQLANFRSLREINFRGNSLNGTVPSFFELEQLSLLNLGRNQFVAVDGLQSNLLETALPTASPTDRRCRLRDILFWWTNDRECRFRDVFFWWLSKTTIMRPSSKTSLSPNENLKTLALYENNIKGTIPWELNRFTNLVDLSLASNLFTGEFPSKLGELGRLKVLDVRNNYLSGTIPTEIAQIHDMRMLQLYNNSFNGTIPTEFGGMNDLTELVLDNNNLTGPIPSVLGNLTKLISLTFAGNILSGPIPSELGDLISVEYLVLHDYSIKGRSKKTGGTLPSELGRLVAWKYIVFQNNGLTGTLPSEFGRLQSSKAFWFQNNGLTGSIPSEIGNNENLEYISLENNGLTGSIPSEIGNFENLKYLSFANNTLVGDVPNELSSLNELEVLRLGGTNVTGELWFMCDLQIFEFPENTIIDCNNYCGTVDEECNHTSIWNATCQDVDCLGDGVPTCTDHCRLNYSSCSASLDQISFRLDLKTDYKGWETSWELKDFFSEDVLWESELTYRNNASLSEFRCMEQSCYIFTISDIGGDGICCGDISEESGNYLLFLDGISVPDVNTSFGSFITYILGNCPTGTPSSSP